MAEIIINSKKNGVKIVLVDDEDYEKLISRKWHYTVGYVSCRLRINGVTKKVSMHRFIMGLSEVGRDYCVDHINHDKLDNRKINLRVCTQGENVMNSKRKNKSSIFKGIERSKTPGKWCARIKAYGEKIHLGTFHTEHEAALAYNKKAIELHGEFAYLNKL